MEGVTLAVDHRERDVWEHLQGLLGAQASLEELPYGDFVVRKGGDAWVWERKSVSDLQASIKDGRFREQRERMISCVAPGRRGYILEGALGTDKRAWGAHWNLICRDGFVVVRTTGTRDTAEALAQFLRKCAEDPSHPFAATAAARGADEGVHTDALCLAARRGANLTPARVYTMQWAMIPGISTAMAERVTQRIPSWVAVQAMGLEEAQRVIADLPSGASGRKFGPKRAAVVCEYLSAIVLNEKSGQTDAENSTNLI